MTAPEDAPRGVPQLDRALAAYVGQVALAAGVPADGVGHEVSDTASAYIGLPDRVRTHPGRDLMLVWDELFGWRVETEDQPDGHPCVVARLRGGPVPAPEVVARFVADVLAGRHTSTLGPVAQPADRATLARMMHDVSTD